MKRSVVEILTSFRFSPGRLRDLFTALLFTAGLVFLVITPPFQAPDEPNHFLRAYQVSQGQLLGTRIDTRSGGMIPAVLDSEVSTFGKLQYTPDARTSIKEWQDKFDQSHPLNKKNTGEKAFTHFPNTVMYSPFPYLPQTIGILLGRTLHLKVLTTLYVCRLFNLICSILLLWFTFSLVEFARSPSLLLFLLAGTPMAIFQMSSASADSLTNSLAFLIIGLVIHLRKNWNRKLLMVFFGASFVLSMAKSAYFPIPWIALPLLLSHAENRRAQLRQMVLLALVTLLPVFAWSALTQGLFLHPYGASQVDPGLQLKHVLHHPWSTLVIFIREAKAHYYAYHAQFIGVLGWLDTPMSPTLITRYSEVLILATLIGSSDSGNLKFNLFDRLTFFSLSVGLVLLLYLLIYLTWLPVGAATHTGMQGRYLIPVVPLFLLSLPALVRLRDRVFDYWLILIVCTWGYLLTRSAFTVSQRYWM